MSIHLFLNFKGNSDIERYQMANKKIPFKYARPVEEWLQEKGMFLSLCVFTILMKCEIYGHGLYLKLIWFM